MAEEKSELRSSALMSVDNLRCLASPACKA